jgi:hypothetical protein
MKPPHPRVSFERELQRAHVAAAEVLAEFGLPRQSRRRVLLALGHGPCQAPLPGAAWVRMRASGWRGWEGSAALEFGVQGLQWRSYAKHDGAVDVGGSAPAAIAGWSDPEAPIRVLTHAAGAKALAWVRSLPLGAMFVERALGLGKGTTGVDLEKDALPLLSGALALSAGLVADGAGKPLSLARPLERIRADVLASVTNSGAMEKLLDTTQKSSGKRVQRDAEGHYSAGPMRWGMAGSTYVYTVGGERLAQAMARAATPSLARVLPPEAALAGATLAIIDAGKLARDFPLRSVAGVLASMGEIVVAAYPKAEGLEVVVRETLP